MKPKLTIYELIGAKIAYYRRLNCFSQEELATKIHMTRSVIARIESGNYNHNIFLNMLMLISKALHVKLSVFVTFDNNELQFLIRDDEDEGV